MEPKQGFYWARQLPGDFELTKGPLSIVFVRGNAPFLTMYLMVSRATSDNPGFAFELGQPPIQLDPANWELVERIEYPKENDE